MGSLNLAELGDLGRIRVDAPFGVRPYRLGHRRHLGRTIGRRIRTRRGFEGLDGYVVDDAQTWIVYGNEILGRSSAAGVGAEAEKAGMNIDTFVGNRGDELAAADQSKLDELNDMKMKLLLLAQGKYKPESVWGSAVEAGTDELAFRAKAGATGVVQAPGKVYEWGKQEAQKAIDYALDKGGEAAKKAALPMALIVGGLAAVGFIIYSLKK